jgi:hypothetical protein
MSLANSARHLVQSTPWAGRFGLNLGLPLGCLWIVNNAAKGSSVLVHERERQPQQCRT